MRNPLLRDGRRVSRPEELKYIALWKEKQDTEALGIVLQSRSRWMMTIIRNLSLPSGADRDSVFADVMGEVFMAMKGFDPSRGTGLSAYLYPIIRRAAFRSAELQNKEVADVDFNYVIDEDPGSAEPVITSLRNLVEATPMDELNDTARLLICRILSGHSNAQIASMMDWTAERTKKTVSHMRNYLAWRMVTAGQSASPWVDDRDLALMAASFEETQREIL